MNGHHKAAHPNKQFHAHMHLTCITQYSKQSSYKLHFVECLVLTNCNWSASLEEKDPLHFETLMSGTSEQWLPKMSPEVITPLHPTFRILLIPGNVVSMVAEKFRSSSSNTSNVHLWYYQPSWKKLFMTSCTKLP